LKGLVASLAAPAVAETTKAAASSLETVARTRRPEREA
jgi:hypothetical protein